MNAFPPMQRGEWEINRGRNKLQLSNTRSRSAKTELLPGATCPKSWPDPLTVLVLSNLFQSWSIIGLDSWRCSCHVAHGFCNRLECARRDPGSRRCREMHCCMDRFWSACYSWLLPNYDPRFPDEWSFQPKFVVGSVCGPDPDSPVSPSCRYMGARPIRRALASNG